MIWGKQDFISKRNLNPNQFGVQKNLPKKDLDQKNSSYWWKFLEICTFAGISIEIFSMSVPQTPILGVHHASTSSQPGDQLGFLLQN